MIKTTQCLVCLAAVLLAGSGCSNKYFRRAAAAVGEEAAYAALTGALVNAGVKSADHMVDAVRLVADKKDYGGALVAFAVALAEHNASGAQRLTSAQVISVMRKAEPSVRRASPRIAGALDGFCDYAESHG